MSYRVRWQQEMVQSNHLGELRGECSDVGLVSRHAGG